MPEYIKCPDCGCDKFKRVTTDAVQIEEDGETLVDSDENINAWEREAKIEIPYDVEYWCLKCGKKIEPDALAQKEHSIIDKQ